MARFNAAWPLLGSASMRKWTGAWLVLTAVLTTSRASWPAPLQPVKEFLAAASTRNVDNREADNIAQQREAEADAAWAKVLPALSARASYTRNQVPVSVTFPGGSPVTITPENQLDAALTLDVPLIDLSAWSRVSTSAALSDAATLRKRTTSFDVKKAVVRQYCLLVGARAVTSAAHRTVEAAESNKRIVQTRLQAGMSSEIDLERASAEVERARQNGADAGYVARVAARALESLSGLRPRDDDQGARPDKDDAFGVDLTDEAPLDRWEQSLRVPSVDAAIAEARASDKSASAARMALVPALSAVVQERFTNATGFANRSAFWTAGVVATWRFDVGTVPTIRAADAAGRAADARTEKTRIAARDRVHDDWQMVVTAIAKSRAARAQLRASNHAAELARERFANGTVTQLEVVQAERDAFAASVARIQSDVDLVYARAVLRLDAGKEIE